MLLHVFALTERYFSISVMFNSKNSSPIYALLLIGHTILHYHSVVGMYQNGLPGCDIYRISTRKSQNLKTQCAAFLMNLILSTYVVWAEARSARTDSQSSPGSLPTLGLLFGLLGPGPPPGYSLKASLTLYVYS